MLEELHSEENKKDGVEFINISEPTVEFFNHKMKVEECFLFMKKKSEINGARSEMSKFLFCFVLLKGKSFRSAKVTDLKPVFSSKQFPTFGIVSLPLPFQINGVLLRLLYVHCTGCSFTKKFHINFVFVIDA